MTFWKRESILVQIIHNISYQFITNEEIQENNQFNKKDLLKSNNLHHWKKQVQAPLRKNKVSAQIWKNNNHSKNSNNFKNNLTFNQSKRQNQKK